MTFTDQWANRHDGECERYPVTVQGITVSSVVPCHCYRRWLEGRLGEVESKLRGAVQAFDAADAIAVREKRRADDLARRLDILAQGMAGLLPPKGAGDECPECIEAQDVPLEREQASVRADLARLQGENQRLEGRLEECHNALRALLPKGEWWGLTFNQRYEKIRHILPPKGAE